MKIQFDSNQQYQLDAIQAMVGLFDGQPLAQGEYEIRFDATGGDILTQLGVGNNLVLDESTVLANLQRVQERNEIESYVTRMLDVESSIYDCVEFESEVERKFAEAMSSREDIKFFIKLPDWFKLETPIGTYNPDWAIVKQPEGEPQRVYLVRETKGTKKQLELRGSEWDKIRCGIAHFDALNVDFEHVTSAEEV